MAWVTVQVHCGPFRGYDNSLASGTITFTPVSGWQRDISIPAEYAPVQISENLVNGETTVTLLAPNAPGDPDSVYKVNVELDGIDPHSFVIRMPNNPQLSVPLELSSRDDNQGILDPSGTGGNSDGGFGGTHGGFGG